MPSLAYINLFNVSAATERKKAARLGKVNSQILMMTWHRRFGHLCARNLQQLAKENMVNDFNNDPSQFLSTMFWGKLHKKPIQTTGGKRTKEQLKLVHSNVCGPMPTPSLSRGLYFLSFINDYIRYMWIYILKRKDRVFEKFSEWKSLVENSSG